MWIVKFNSDNWGVVDDDTHYSQLSELKLSFNANDRNSMQALADIIRTLEVQVFNLSHTVKQVIKACTDERR